MVVPVRPACFSGRIVAEHEAVGAAGSKSDDYRHGRVP